MYQHPLLSICIAFLISSIYCRKKLFMQISVYLIYFTRFNEPDPMEDAESKSDIVKYTTVGIICNKHSESSHIL